MPSITKAPTGSVVSTRIKVAVTDGNEIFNSGVSLLDVGGPVDVRDDGVSLTSDVTKLNFVGFELTEPTDDEITISFGVLSANTEYCPGYSYTNIDSDEWRITGLNVINLFSVGRRLRFVDGANTYFGTITASAYTASNTDMTMSMEDGDTLTGTISEVCLTSGTAGWSPISADPFGGSSINDICVGDIGATTWLFAVGNSGKCGVSSDGGIVWTMLTTGTNEHLNACVYDSNNETFWGGGNVGVLVSTTNATSITLDTSSIDGLGSGNGTYNISGFAYNSGEDGLLCISNVTTTNSWSIYSTNQGSTWVTGGDLSSLVPASMISVKSQVNAGGGTGLILRAAITNSAVFKDASSGVTDTSWATGSNTLHPISAIGHFEDGAFAIVSGSFDGHIIGTSNWTGDDTATFSNRVRAFAFSDLHDRLICVGDNAQLGYLDETDKAANDSWTSISNGFSPTADIHSVVWDDTHAVFVAVAENGQICRSSSGIN